MRKQHIYHRSCLIFIIAILIQSAAFIIIAVKRIERPKSLLCTKDALIKGRLIAIFSILYTYKSNPTGPPPCSCSAYPATKTSALIFAWGCLTIKVSLFASTYCTPVLFTWILWSRDLRLIHNSRDPIAFITALAWEFLLPCTSKS